MSRKSGVHGKTPHQVARSLGATKRKELYENRTTEEQLVILEGRPGRSVKERARLRGKEND